MRRSFLAIIVTLSVPLFLFVNVLQSERYMMEYFEVRGLINSQEELVQNNKKLINRVAELESPARVFEYIDTNERLKKIGGGQIVRLEVIGLDD